MGDDFPELKTSQERIYEILTIEEESFFRTLLKGGQLLSQVIESSKDKGQKISGEDAFKLKDTYGFPLEEIQLIAKCIHQALSSKGDSKRATPATTLIVRMFLLTYISTRSNL